MASPIPQAVLHFGFRPRRLESLRPASQGHALGVLRWLRRRQPLGVLHLKRGQAEFTCTPDVQILEGLLKIW